MPLALFQRMTPKRPNDTDEPMIDRNPYDEPSERKQADDRAADEGGHGNTGGFERDPAHPFER